jgi:hypothetical protein
MEQVKQLLEILSETPEMALWGLGMYLLYILIKLASWVTALALVMKLFINKLFDYKNNKIESERDKTFSKFVDSSSYADQSKWMQLFSEMSKRAGSIYSSDIEKATKILRNHRWEEEKKNKAA